MRVMKLAAGQGAEIHKTHTRAFNAVSLSRPGRDLITVPASFAIDRRALVAAPAETDEGRSGVVELRFAGTRPPFPPFAFETVNVIAGRGVASVLISFIGQGGQSLRRPRAGGVQPMRCRD